MSYTFISILDNIVVQLAILGAVLAMAVVSPPVAIVAMITVVTVYYMRNVSKVDSIEPSVEINENIQYINTTNNNIQMNVSNEEVLKLEHELTQNNIAVVHPDHSQEKHKEEKHKEEKLLSDHEVNTKRENENKDVLETALGESESRMPLEETIGSNSRVGGEVAMEDKRPPAHEDFPDPRKTGAGEGFEVKSLDTQAEFHGSVPPSYGTKSQMVDSSVFTPPSKLLDGYNEVVSPPTIRSFTDNAGQFTINSSRPSTLPEKYEVADYMPGSDMGSNDYSLYGASIDDKISFLNNSFVQSTTPPPNFSNVIPKKAERIQ
jgi:hypothetical protein